MDMSVDISMDEMYTRTYPGYASIYSCICALACTYAFARFAQEHVRQHKAPTLPSSLLFQNKRVRHQERQWNATFLELIRRHESIASAPTPKEIRAIVLLSHPMNSSCASEGRIRMSGGKDVFKRSQIQRLLNKPSI